MTTNKAPIERLRDGWITASIWRNSGEKGVYYSVQITREYRTADGFSDTTRFRSRDLPVLSILAERAYVRIQELRAADKAANAEPEAAK